MLTHLTREIMHMLILSPANYNFLNTGKFSKIIILKFPIFFSSFSVLTHCWVNSFWCEIKEECFLKKWKKTELTIQTYTRRWKINNVVKVMLCMQTLYFQTHMEGRHTEMWGENEDMSGRLQCYDILPNSRKIIFVHLEIF